MGKVRDVPCAFRGLIILLCLNAGCFSPKNVRTLGSAVAMGGQKVSSAALDAYTELSKQAEIDKEQQDFIKVATSPNPGAGLPDTPATPFTKQLGPRIAAYRALLKTYLAFQALTDKTFGDPTTTSSASLLASFDGLKAIPDLPAAVSNALPGVSKLVADAQQAKRIVAYNRALTELSTVYQQLWQADLASWNNYLTFIYKTYADGLLSLDSSRFNSERLSHYVKQPFSKELDVAFYKLHEREVAFSRRDAVMARLQQVNSAFVKLQSAQMELSKAKPNVVDALAALDEIDISLYKAQ